MRFQFRRRPARRKGAVCVLYAILLVPVLGMVALAVDYGYLLTIRVDLQRVADQAALAAVRDLVPTPEGFQDLEEVKRTVRDYVAHNSNGKLQVVDSDIEIGRYDPQTIYTTVDILNTGIFDTVKVTVRRDQVANTSVALFFARVLGIDNADISASATAVLQKAQFLTGGSDLLPMSIPQDVWNIREPGDAWSVYGDGKMTDEYGNDIPGNWGTLDIGNFSNSTSELNDQILNGLRQEDLDALYNANIIETNTHIDSQRPMTVNGDTGISTGLKHSVQNVHGLTKLIPIYASVNDQSGGGLDFNVVGWGVVQVVDSRWKGSKHTYVEIQKAYMYDGDLRPHPDLGNTTDVIENAYTSPVLVQ